MTILTEGFLITSQWTYAVFFLKKKREKITQEGRVLSKKAKYSIAWIIGVIVVNTLQFVGKNIYEGYLEFVKEVKPEDEPFYKIVQYC